MSGTKRDSWRAMPNSSASSTSWSRARLRELLAERHQVAKREIVPRRRALGGVDRAIVEARLPRVVGGEQQALVVEAAHDVEPLASRIGAHVELGQLDARGRRRRAPKAASAAASARQRLADAARAAGPAPPRRARRRSRNRRRAPRRSRSPRRRVPRRRAHAPSSSATRLLAPARAASRRSRPATSDHAPARSAARTRQARCSSDSGAPAASRNQSFASGLSCRAAWKAMRALP